MFHVPNKLVRTCIIASIILIISPAGCQPRKPKKVKTKQKPIPGVAILPAEDALSCRAITRARCDDGRRKQYPALFTSPPVAPQTLRAISSLQNVRIGAVGDSVTEQLFQALQCYLSRVPPAHGLSFSKFVELHSVPLNATELRRFLVGALRGVDVAVVSFGSWYDWDGDDAAAPPLDAARVAPDAAEALVKACVFPDEVARAGFAAVMYGPVWDGALPSRTRRVAVRRRYACAKPLLGPLAFASDLTRLVGAVRHERRRLPLLVWKDVAPQHFAGRASGRWEGSGRGKVEACGAVENERLAYARNAIADAILAADGTSDGTFDGTSNGTSDGSADGADREAVSGADRGSNRGAKAPGASVASMAAPPAGPPAFAAVARTWGRDLPLWRLHAGDYTRAVGGGGAVDCTHFCSPSIATWGWAAAVLEAFAAVVAEGIARSGNDADQRRPPRRSPESPLLALPASALNGPSRDRRGSKQGSKRESKRRSISPGH